MSETHRAAADVHHRRAPCVELYWLPLGAGGHVVPHTGRLYEAVTARRDHREAQPLFHSALRICTDSRAVVIEMAPVWNNSAPQRGVVCEGPVGATWLGRMRLFRYEVRCWEDGVIPDVAEAVDSPHLVSDDLSRATGVLDVVPTVPALTWGRDELGVADMWNSNSLTSWLLARTGHDMAGIAPPHGGRAPGWLAGLALADRQTGG